MKPMRAFVWAALLFCLLVSACTGTATPQTTVTVPAATTLPQPTATDLPPAATETPTVDVTVTPAVGQSVQLWRIDMIDAMQGWAEGILPGEQFERVLRTSDGGQTWQDVTPPARAAQTGSVATAALTAFAGTQHAWVLYYAPAPVQSPEAFFTYSTVDGGVTWQAGEPLDLNGLMMDFFLPGEIGFSDKNNGWLLAHLGAGMNHDYIALFTTNDAGQSWTRVVEPPQGETSATSLPMSCAKTGVTFVDAQNGWVAGNCQGVVDEVYLYRTRDGGVNWQLAELPAPAEQLALQNQQNACGAEPPVFSGQTGYLPVACVGADGGKRWLYRSDDGGETWTALDAPAVYGALAVTPGQTPLLLGSDDRSGEEPRTLYASEDSGQTWQARLADIAWSGALDFVDEQNGWALVNAGEERQLLRTRDGGRTWETLVPVLLE